MILPWGRSYQLAAAGEGTYHEGEGNASAEHFLVDALFLPVVIWFWILITVFIDIFRSPDLGGFAKAMWFLFVLFIPLIGVLVYLIARGGKMHEHAVQDQRQQDQEFRANVQEAAGSQSTADELAKLADLHDRGDITDAEFEREKAKILS